MRELSVAIIGVGAVGRAMRDLFPDAVLYDEPLGLGTREAVNRCRFAFVCVPTPPLADGSCDTSIVEDVVRWCESGTIVVRSTVAPGTTARLAAASGKRLVFQPEYGPGETPDHPYAHARDIGWMILGGSREATRDVHELYTTVVSSRVVIQQTDATTAELAKYMENAFLATKVTFCNEFYDLAAALQVDYAELRELWLLDPRMGRSHTWVHVDDRGFGGSCLPKDLDALIAASRAVGVRPALLAAVAEANAAHRRRRGGPAEAPGAREGSPTGPAPAAG